MVMDDPESVAQFHEGGASNPGQQAVYDFSARALDALVPHGGRLIDLGVGSGRALSALLRRRPDIEATAVDLAPNMLASARELFVAEGHADRVELIEADITALPDRLATADWPLPIGKGFRVYGRCTNFPTSTSCAAQCARLRPCAETLVRRYGFATFSG
jgi:SAM-dependent methyltransferase